MTIDSSNWQYHCRFESQNGAILGPNDEIIMDCKVVWPTKIEPALSHLVKCAREHDNLADLLTLALPYVEDAAEDPAHQAAHVLKLVERIRTTIERLDSYPSE